MILFAPQCPTALGCRFERPGGATNSWWGWLQYSGTYDEAWLGRQIDRVVAAYHVDAAREYSAGWSGGADYLGWYALRHARRFAAAAFVGGGVPYVTGCPAGGLPAYFLDGAADPRFQSGQPERVRRVLASCGSETRLVVLPAADHTATLSAVQSGGYASRIVRWFGRHPRR
jgi:poly(3-hydroxybutyrate) depolymerase